MAEENVVIPRDKYNRMLEQLRNSKDFKGSKENKLTQQEDNTTDIRSAEHVTQPADTEHVTHTLRSKDDIVLKETHHPPGLKHNDIDIFMKKFTTNNRSRNITKLKTPTKRKTVPLKSRARKSRLKANWISVSK